MTSGEMTLDELSERTGVESRTLRSWVSEGLLAPPFKPGRGARYPASNADRALAVRALKDLHGLSLSEIGRRFMMATDDQIREWATQAGPITTSRGLARDYIRQIQASSSARAPAERVMASHQLANEMPRGGRRSFAAAPRDLSELPLREPLFSAKQADLASIEWLIVKLAEGLEAPAPRRSKGAAWTRIPITPDLELSVRGDLEPHEQALFEQLADQFRAILTGRVQND